MWRRPSASHVAVAFAGPQVPLDTFISLGTHGVGGQQGSRDVLGHSCRRGLEGQRCRDELAFVNFRTLMVATDWSDKDAMGELAIAGHVCAVLQLLGILAHLHVLQAFCDSIVTVLLFVYCTHYILRIENLNQNNQYYQILSLFW
jgi:hypothetical protein